MSNWCRAPFIFLSVLMVLGAALQVGVAQTPAPNSRLPQANLVGRWQVALTLAGVKKNLIFEAQVRGSGLFWLLDAGPDDRSAGTPLRALWSRNTHDRVSFTGDAELPLGSCCVEKGTVVFKGRFESRDSITGKVVFVTSIDEDESPFKLRSVIGTFTAVRIIQRTRSKSGTAGTWLPGELHQQGSVLAVFASLRELTSWARGDSR